MVSDGRMEWRRILCETNVDASIIEQVQMSLRNAGHNPGPIDGVIGHQRQAALKSYQRANNLAEGGLTYETLRHMNISL
jgi:peptidoglycan hydrolase-like protein with peptidoglycan-binding domain